MRSPPRFMESDVSRSIPFCLTEISADQEGMVNSDPNPRVVELEEDQCFRRHSTQSEGTLQMDRHGRFEEVELVSEAGTAINE